MGQQRGRHGLEPDPARTGQGDQVEAIAAEDFSLVSKQRLQIVRRELFEQLDELDL